MFDPAEIKKDFPIFEREMNGHPLVYMDNAATTQKPRQVISAITNYYETMNANVHRGIHTLSEEATEAYENGRKTVANFIGAESEREIIFTRNATEAINLVAYTWGERQISDGDEIIISELEHHSNLVPWQELCKRKNATLKVIPIKEDFTPDFEEYEKLLSPKTKLVAITGISNVTGTITDIRKIVEPAKNSGAKVLIDGAQMSAHMTVNMQKLECDFFVMSAHKMLGPTGVGALFAKEEILKDMPPFQFGGDMIRTVSQFDAKWNDLPWRFEAGTPNIAGVVAFGEAIKYLQNIGMHNVLAHDQKLLKLAKTILLKNPKVKIFAPENGSSVLSFIIRGIHPHDIATVFNSEGVAIRAGTHCAEPLLQKMGIPATARLSFYIYNTEEDVLAAEKAMQKALELFK